MMASKQYWNFDGPGGQELHRPRVLGAIPEWRIWHARALIGSILTEGFCTDAGSIQGTEMMAGKPPNAKLTDACAWKAPYGVHGKSVAPL
jgi:hypothetical protein